MKSRFKYPSKEKHFNDQSGTASASSAEALSRITQAEGGGGLFIDLTKGVRRVISFFTSRTNSTMLRYVMRR